MANNNGFWKKLGVITLIFTTFGTILLSYADTKNLGENNTKDITELKGKVEKGFDRMEEKFDEFNHRQTAIEIQNREIFVMVKFLSDKAKE